IGAFLAMFYIIGYVFYWLNFNKFRERGKFTTAGLIESYFGLDPDAALDDESERKLFENVIPEPDANLNRWLSLADDLNSDADKKFAKALMPTMGDADDFMDYSTETNNYSRGDLGSRGSVHFGTNPRVKIMKDG